MLFRSAPVVSLGWHVLVEEPADEAFAPALAAATRNAVLLAFGLGIAVFSSLALARRMGRSLSALQGEVAKRTEELARANEAKSRLVAAAGHDLRQPLHALGLFAAQLSSKSLPADGRPLAHGIEASVRSLGEMLDSLLDLSRLEAGQLEARMIDFSLDAMFASLRRHFEPAAREKGLVLRVRAGGHVTRSDPALLERIAMNLLSNAIRYTSRGGVLLAARRRGDHLLLQVWDTGSGIAPSRQGEIFSEFVRLAEPGGRDSPGLGIGLAIVDRLSRLLNAPLRVRSCEDRGSVFTIELPLGDGALARVSPIRAPESLAGCTIAVVDDDPTSLSGMRGLLESWGCIVIAAASGDELLLSIDRRIPDVLISDLRLREESGDAVVRRLRAACDAPVPAFLVSGDTSNAAARVAAEAGLAILRKPVLPMKLRAMLTHAIAGGSVVSLESTAVSS